MWSPRRDADAEGECEAKRQRRNSTEGEDKDREVPAPVAGTSSTVVVWKELEEMKDNEEFVVQAKINDEPMKEDSVYSLDVIDALFPEHSFGEEYFEENLLARVQPGNLFGRVKNLQPVKYDEPEQPEPKNVTESCEAFERVKKVYEYIQRAREEKKLPDLLSTNFNHSLQQIRTGKSSGWKNVFKGENEELDTIEKVLAESKACNATPREDILKDHIVTDSIDEMLADEMRKGGLLEGIPAEKVFRPPSGSSFTDEFPRRRFYDEMRKEHRKQLKKKKECPGNLGLSADDVGLKELSALCGEDLVVLDEPDFLGSASEEVPSFDASQTPEVPWRDIEFFPSTTERESKSPPILDFDTLLTHEEPNYDSLFHDWRLQEVVANHLGVFPLKI